jgi:hypothetical protein
MASHRTQANPPSEDAAEQLRRRLGALDPQQVAIWRAMSPARRLELAFQAYQFALDIVRFTERRAHPELSPEELNWRITRRMQGDQSLGRKQTSASQEPGEEE